MTAIRTCAAIFHFILVLQYQEYLQSGLLAIKFRACAQDSFLHAMGISLTKVILYQRQHDAL